MLLFSGVLTVFEYLIAAYKCRNRVPLPVPNDGNTLIGSRRLYLMTDWSGNRRHQQQQQQVKLLFPSQTVSLGKNKTSELISVVHRSRLSFLSHSVAGVGSRCYKTFFRKSRFHPKQE